MSANILITGAAGYVGGSLVADFLASNNPSLSKDHVLATVRTQEQAEALSKLGVKVLRLDLSDEAAVTESVLHHNISIVIQTASSLDPGLSLPLIAALAKQRELSGKETYFIQTSGLGAFIEKTGWPAGVTHDTDPIFEIEKRLDSSPLRKNDVTVIEYAKEAGVTSFIVVPSQVYGKGTGPWNQLSMSIPLYVSALIAHKKVSRFPQNATVSGVHISDLTGLYRLIVERILRQESIESGTKGYYFALAHDLPWWEVIDGLAKAFKARGLLEDAEPRTWSSDAEAAQTLGIPEPFVQVLFNAGDNFIATNEKRIGWIPKWDKARFFENIDDEIDAVVELKKAKSSLVDSLFKAVQG